MERSLNELLIEANKGNQASYERLLLWLSEHCKTQLKNGLSRYYNFPKEAFDDITQEVLITFHTIHQTYDSSRPLLPWINSIIRHKMIDFIRKKDFVVMMNGPDIEILKGSWIIDDENVSVANADHLKIIIQTLPSEHYEILKLSKIEGYSSKEIARELNLTDSNVKVTLHRMLKKLKKLALGKNNP
jgi:RNA polymerase sigma-70 factor (ECF subfamily)